MDVRESFTEAVGNTPLIKLRRASELTGCEILGKAEFLNPGGSVKDRAALSIMLDAEARGELQPGGVIVEGTAGNTGIGLALVGNARGYRTVIVIPRDAEPGEEGHAAPVGAELREVPAVPYRDPNNYVHVAERLAEELARSEPNGVHLGQPVRQPRQPRRPLPHDRPRDLAADRRPVDGFICAIGTGGTLAGVGAFLKERKPDVRDRRGRPDGRGDVPLLSSTASSKAEGSSITEGIGQGRDHRATSRAPPSTTPYQIPDEEALPVLFDLSARRACASAARAASTSPAPIRVARELGPGHTIVTILSDYGTRYQSKLFNPAFLREKGLPVRRWLA